MASERSIELVTQSFGRCIVRGDLFSKFYDIFLASSPEIAPRFANTDFDKQKLLLRQGINYALMRAKGSQAAENSLARIRESHSKKNLDVEPRMYPLWKSAFLQAIEQADEEITPEVKAAWDEVLQETVDFVAGGYLD